MLFCVLKHCLFAKVLQVGRRIWVNFLSDIFLLWIPPYGTWASFSKCSQTFPQQMSDNNVNQSLAHIWRVASHNVISRFKCTNLVEERNFFQDPKSATDVIWTISGKWTVWLIALHSYTQRKPFHRANAPLCAQPWWLMDTERSVYTAWGTFGCPSEQPSFPESSWWENRLFFEKRKCCCVSR